MRIELKLWADKSLGKSVPFNLGSISKLSAQRYAMAVDDRNPLYFDEEYAKLQGHPGLVVPPNYLVTLRGEQEPGPPEDELLEDGMAPSARPPVSNLMGMGGGQQLVFHQHVYCGDTIHGLRSVTDVQEKIGRSGPLVIIEDEVVYFKDTGQAVITLRNTLLCRWAAGGEQ